MRKMIECREIYHGVKIFTLKLREQTDNSKTKASALRMSEFFDGPVKEAVLGIGMKNTGISYLVNYTLTPAGGKCIRKYGERSMLSGRYLTDGRNIEELEMLFQSIQMEALIKVQEIAGQEES